jgi:hypothetical protein
MEATGGYYESQRHRDFHNTQWQISEMEEDLSIKSGAEAPQCFLKNEKGYKPRYCGRLSEGRV